MARWCDGEMVGWSGRAVEHGLMECRGRCGAPTHFSLQAFKALLCKILNLGHVFERKGSLLSRALEALLILRVALGDDCVRELEDEFLEQLCTRCVERGWMRTNKGLGVHA